MMPHYAFSPPESTMHSDRVRRISLRGGPFEQAATSPTEVAAFLF